MNKLKFIKNSNNNRKAIIYDDLTNTNKYSFNITDIKYNNIINYINNKCLSFGSISVSHTTLFDIYINFYSEKRLIYINVVNILERQSYLVFTIYYDDIEF